MPNTIHILQQKTGWKLSILSKILGIPYTLFHKLQKGERNANALYMGRITDALLALSDLPSDPEVSVADPDPAWIQAKLDELDLLLLRKEKETRALHEKHLQMHCRKPWLQAFRNQQEEADPAWIRYWNGLQKETEDELQHLKKTDLAKARTELAFLKHQRQFWQHLLEQRSPPETEVGTVS